MVRSCAGRREKKKLKDAAAEFVRRGTEPKVIDSTEEDLAAFGIRSLQPVEDDEPEPVFEVWPENADAVRMFIVANTQWRCGPGGLLGLDYVALFALFKLYGIKNRKKVLADIQVMEVETLELLSRQAHVDD